MSGDPVDPDEAAANDLKRIREQLQALGDRDARTAKSRKRLYDEIARVEVYLIRRRPKG